MQLRSASIVSRTAERQGSAGPALSISSTLYPISSVVTPTTFCQPMPGQQQAHVGQRPPIQDSPYVRAKRCQLIDKDPQRAIPLFWASINANDRTDSALKDMAIVMKQQGRPEEAIEAIRSFRSRCSPQAQESLDNVLLDLYKRCGRLDDQIELLTHKILQLESGAAFQNKKTKVARSQGKKLQVSAMQEHTRLLGNLGWAYMERGDFVCAEAVYRRALAMQEDDNKLCNLAVCLMKQGKLGEAEALLRRVKQAPEGPALDACSGQGIAVGPNHAHPCGTRPGEEDCVGEAGADADERALVYGEGDGCSHAASGRGAESCRKSYERAAALLAEIQGMHAPACAVAYASAPPGAHACMPPPQMAPPLPPATGMHPNGTVRPGIAGMVPPNQMPPSASHHAVPVTRHVVGPAVANAGATCAPTRSACGGTPMASTGRVTAPILVGSATGSQGAWGGGGAAQLPTRQAAQTVHVATPPAPNAAPQNPPAPAAAPTPLAAVSLPPTRTAAASTVTVPASGKERAAAPPGFGAARGVRAHTSPLGEKRSREKDEDSGDGIRFSLAGGGEDAEEVSSAPAPLTAKGPAITPAAACATDDRNKDTIRSTAVVPEGPHSSGRPPSNPAQAEGNSKAEPQLSLRPNGGRLVSPRTTGEARSGDTMPTPDKGQLGVTTRAASNMLAPKLGKENQVGRDAASKVTASITNGAREGAEPLIKVVQESVDAAGKATPLVASLLSLPPLPEDLSICVADLPLPGKRRKRLPFFENLAAMSPV